MPDAALPSIVPLPPVATAALPWDRELADPVAELAAARAECGDTFVVDGPEQRTLFVFSPEGVRSFYALAEADASKGVADWMMLRRKLPDELFDGRRTMPTSCSAVTRCATTSPSSTRPSTSRSTRWEALVSSTSSRSRAGSVTAWVSRRGPGSARHAT